ncbi:MAG: DUF2169 domain-containing protein [Polyangiaceae bacterium]
MPAPTITDPKPAYTRVHRRSALHVAFFTARREVDVATLTIVVKGTFAIEPGEIVRALDPTDQPPLFGDLYWGDDPTTTLRYPTDFAPFKPHADTMLVGTCRAAAPGTGEARKGGRVEFGVGKRTKVLALAGDRAWETGVGGAVPGKPSTLGDVELRYENAFGGPGYPDNPVGRGYVPKDADPEGRPLPSLELADALVRSTSDRPLPAGFGPLEYVWKQRAAFAGTYDERWRRERWPWYPADFEWGYFNAAPMDQQVKGYLKGDERFHFAGIHPRLERVDAKLPALRPRVFAKRRAGSRGEPFEEVALSLDTLWVDADAMRVSLVWRGAVAIEAMRSREVEGLLLVDESMHDPPAPRDSYAADAYWHVPEPTIEELADHEEAAARAAPMPEQGDDEERALADARALLEQGNASPELIEKLSKVSSIDAFLHVVRGEMKEPTEEEKKRVEEIIAANDADADTKLRALGHDPGELKPKPPVDAPPREKPGRWTRERVITHAAEKRSFADADLSSLDLSDIDLSGLNLTNAKLDEADLSRAKLDQADLTSASLRATVAATASFVDALLVGVYAVGADLRCANLQRANAAQMRAHAATFADADLGLADLSDADLSEADLTGAILEAATAERANLRDAKAARLRASRASLREADLTRADLVEADLSGANLSFALLDGASMDRLRGREILLSRARGAKVSLMGADLSEARAAGCKLDASALDGVRADASIWVGASLQASSLTKATFIRADFSEAELAASTFHFSVMKQANLSRAKLGAAKLTKVDLFQSLLQGADLSAADCRGSNFFGSDFTQTITTHARFERSNVKRTLLAGQR